MQTFPLPRKGVGLATGGLIALGILGVIMPIVMLVAWSRSGNNPLESIREGGALLMLDLLLLLVGAPLAAVMGALMIRGGRVPAIVLLLAAALPFVIAIVSSWAGMSLVVGAISGESVDLSQKARIMAEGIAETMAGDLFGGLVAGGVAIVAAAACAANVATVAGPTPKTPVPVIVGGALWFVASFAVGVLRIREPGPRAFSPLLVVIALVPFAIAAGRQANALTQWNDKAEAQRIGGGLVAGTVLAVFGVLAIQRALEASVLRPALAALGSASLDPAQRMRILAEGIYGIKLAPAAYAVHVVFGVLTFGLALAPLFGKGPDGSARSPITGGAIGAVAIGLVLVLLAFGLSYKRTSSIEALDKASFSPAGVTLPSASSEVAGDGVLHGIPADVTVKKGDPSSGVPAKCSGERVAYVYADKDATAGALQTAALGTTACAAKLVLRTKHELPPESVAALGTYAKLVGVSDGIPFELDVSPAKTRHTMEIDSVSPTQVRVDGEPHPFPFAAGDRPDGNPDRIIYTFRQTDTVDHMVQVISTAESGMFYSLSQNSAKRYVTFFM